MEPSTYSISVGHLLAKKALIIGIGTRISGMVALSMSEKGNRETSTAESDQRDAWPVRV